MDTHNYSIDKVEELDNNNIYGGATNIDKIGDEDNGEYEYANNYEDKYEDGNMQNNNMYGGAKKKTTIKDEEKDDETTEKDVKDVKDDEKDVKDDEKDVKDDEKDDEKDVKDKEDESISINNTTDIEYKIDYLVDYLVDDDEKLIDVEKIKIQVDTYIDNYYSEIMKKYKNTFNKLYQRYANKKYNIKILPVKDKYNSTKIIVTKNDKKNTIVTELTKPHYLYYDENANLYKLKNTISNERAGLLYKYQILVSQINVSPEDKSNFEKERIKFIKLLEEYYIYTLYHKKINKISVDNKTNLIIQSKYFIDKEDKITSVLSGDTYLIDNNIINNINNYNIDKLTKYNNIILQLSGKNQKDIKKDTKLMEEMKIYLDKKEKVEFMKSLDINKKLQDEYIKYIILRLPIINQ